MINTDQGQFRLSIFETGVPPRFRLHFVDRAGQPTAPPRNETYFVQTLRNDGCRQDFAFEDRSGEYLEATEILPEPHEFEVTLRMRDRNRQQSYDLRFTEHDHEHAHEHGAGLKGLILGALHLDHSHGMEGHGHGSVSSALLSNERGIWALKWSFVGLGITALIQVAVVMVSGSAGLLADTIH
ncbi:MAG: hypothetical protein HW416_3417, partial [Chloroflexi bacterium]|nr:hypothetical protein [Chloroflexota bacterium]